MPSSDSRRRIALRVGLPILLVGTGAAALAAPAEASVPPVITVTASAGTVIAGQTETITVSGTADRDYAAGAHVDVTASGGAGSLPAYTTLGSCGGVATSCTEYATGYRVGLPKLVRGRTYSITVAVTVDAGTAPVSVTPTAQAFLPSGATNGAYSGAAVRIVTAADLELPPAGASHGTPGSDLLRIQFYVLNLGPGVLDTADLTFSISPAAPLVTSPVVDGRSVFACTGTGTVACTMTGPIATPMTGTTFNLDYQVTPGTYVFTAHAVSPEDPTGANNTRTITCTVTATGDDTCS